jgi:hypothetical protein
VSAAVAEQPPAARGRRTDASARGARPSESRRTTSFESVIQMAPDESWARLCTLRLPSTSSNVFDVRR